MAEINPGAGAGEQQPNPGAFDSDAFMTKMLAEMDKRTNATDKKFNALLQKLEAKPEPKPGDGGEPKPGDAEPPKDPKSLAEMNALVHRLSKQVETLTEDNVRKDKAAKESETKRLETERISAFDNFIAEIPFADTKARETFRRANLGTLIRDEDGSFVVETPAGPMAPAEYYKTEAVSLPGLLQQQGHRGAGATAGTKAFGGQKLDVSTMSTTEIQKLPLEQRNQALSHYLSQMTEGL